jgi:2-polyprenyl-3-methyl-5-hydroxy-6-metoxy-1,4-benzoquinol methylase
VLDATSQASATIDWTDALERGFRHSFIEAIKSLDIGSLQRYPPPKRGGLPLGHELRVVRRFLRGGSSMLDQSAFSTAYRALASDRQRLTYRAVVTGDELSHDEWNRLVGQRTVGEWTAERLLAPTATGGLRARFRAIATSGLVLIVDPLDDTFRFRVHIGQDSLNMAEFLRSQNLPREARALDVGTGSGILLMTVARGRHEGVGVDINPRAVRLATFNVDLNGLRNCRVELRDVFESAQELGRFDIVTWNTPIHVLSGKLEGAECGGYGGHLGIEIPLRFIDRLPSLIGERGRAFVLAAGPRMLDGSNRLDVELHDRACSLGLDVVAHVLQTFWVPGLRDFYSQHGVRNFESVMLEISPGRGRVVRREPSVATIAADLVRDLIYRIRK